MKQLFGGLLLAIGILIAGLSGLCSLIAIADLNQGASTSGGENFVTLPAVLIFGGAPFVIGLGIAFAGWRLLKSRSAPASQPQQPATAIKPATPPEAPTSDPE